MIKLSIYILQVTDLSTGFNPKDSVNIFTDLDCLTQFMLKNKLTIGFSQDESDLVSISKNVTVSVSDINLEFSPSRTAETGTRNHKLVLEELSKKDFGKQ